MRRYITRRLGYSLLSLVLLSITIFLFVRVAGDPVALLVEPGASAGDIAAPGVDSCTRAARPGRAASA